VPDIPATAPRHRRSHTFRRG